MQMCVCVCVRVCVCVCVCVCVLRFTTQSSSGRTTPKPYTRACEDVCLCVCVCVCVREAGLKTQHTGMSPNDSSKPQHRVQDVTL